MADENLEAVAHEADHRTEHELREARTPAGKGLRIKTDVRCGAGETNGHPYP